MNNTSQSTIICNILAPALGLWLKREIERVEELNIDVSGGDFQILRGYIPIVYIASRRAVYQGLHLTQVKLKGENIRINLGQILRGKALHLLEPVKVTVESVLEESDLEASLASPLLSNALRDLLLALLTDRYPASTDSGVNSDRSKPALKRSGEFLEQARIIWQRATVTAEKLILAGTLIDSAQNESSLQIQAGLELANPHTLRLHPLQIEGVPESLDFHLNEFQIDLGPDVELKQLSLASGNLICSGRLTIVP